MGNRASIPSIPETNADSQPAMSVANKSTCPILSDAEVGRVYNELLKPAAEREQSEKLSDRNAMPVGLRNKPMKGQEKHLSTDRIVSTIPKGGSNDTWIYPSPQMFFNGYPYVLTLNHMICTQR